MTIRPSYHTPNLFDKEGQDHINICLTSESQLGKLLDPSYHRTVNYPHIGKFGSVLNLWYWLKYVPTDDRFRTADYKNLHKIAISEDLAGSYVPNFKAIIAYATYLKLIAYPDILKEIRKGPEKPLLCYHYPRKCSTRVCNGYASVVVPICEYLIKSVREERVPDFKDLIVNQNQANLCYLEGFARARFSDDVLKRLGL